MQNCSSRKNGHKNDLKQLLPGYIARSILNLFGLIDFDSKRLTTLSLGPSTVVRRRPSQSEAIVYLEKRLT